MGEQTRVGVDEKSRDEEGKETIIKAPEDNEALFPISFLCPNGTIFNQEVFVCEWW